MTTLPATQYRADPSDLWWKKRAQWIYESILSEEIVDHDDVEPTTHRVVIEQIGRLSLPGGRFVAADPYIMDVETNAVRADSADRIGGGRRGARPDRARPRPDGRADAALGTNATISSWSMATTRGQDVTTLAGEGSFGYGVDAGTGSFGGVDAMAVACRVLAEDAGMLEDPISLAVEAEETGPAHALCIAPEAGAVPIAVCGSGFGRR
ncbi:DUF4241 domain-containing protein [Flexivirga oryzae]|uniref:Uncharacterized protein n=1 Tax=Flexivirga oryzae TaxID=1794944 RepID=A0A839NBG0_9MICO|nr:DUF4241 domain-containing protein [Flexivirga oryzae]MBB2894179.1 hypothetical protein [Flexivirga oryzae]